MASDEQTPAPGNPGNAGNPETPGSPDHAGSNEPGPKRKRRRRGGRRNRANKPDAAAPLADQPNPAAQPATNDAPTRRPRDADRNNTPADAGPRPPRAPRPPRPDTRRHSSDADPDPDNDNDQSPGDGNAKSRKKRKPRTKQCVHCYTPCTTIHKVRLDYRKQWVFICDICWPTRCLDNPHYEYDALWSSGRLLRPNHGQDAAATH